MRKGKGMGSMNKEERYTRALATLQSSGLEFDILTCSKLLNETTSAASQYLKRNCYDTVENVGFGVWRFKTPPG